MTKHKMIEQVAEKYRSEGYQVTMAAGKGVLPEPIHHLREQIDLIARKGEDVVAVEVKRRDQLYEIQPLGEAVKHHLPGWSYDLVVYPPNGIDGIPLEDGEPAPEYVESLLSEAQRLLDFGMPRAAFLVGWSGIETVMRTSAGRDHLEIGDGSPHFVLKTLYSNGIISFEDYDRLRLSLEKRNRLVHGLSVDRLDPEDVRFVIEFARQLLCPSHASLDA